MAKTVAKIDGKTIQGLILAAIEIRRDMENTDPKIPVDTGNLRASFFVVSSKGSNIGRATDSAKTLIKGKNPIVIMGFGANYAVVVHEDMETTKNWNRPGSGPKFMEKALERNKMKVLQTIALNVKL